MLIRNDTLTGALWYENKRYKREFSRFNLSE